MDARGYVLVQPYQAYDPKGDPSVLMGGRRESLRQEPGGGDIGRCPSLFLR